MEKANNGSEALQFLQNSFLYNIIFWDLNMPKMNGFEVLQKIKENPDYKDIPVVVVSASTYQRYGFAHLRPTAIRKNKLAV